MKTFQEELEQVGFAACLLAIDLDNLVLVSASVGGQFG
jgi:hypothetical protein